ncbi:hypothetical protein JHK87_047356 [Glycine soja]|nr:hypothetical protein JHK87_047356 [Glycine soja]
MGFLVGYTELVMAKVFLQVLSVLGFIMRLITILLCYMGFQDFFESNITGPKRAVSAVLMREILPVVKFSEMEMAVEAVESCAVCLYEFEGEDEIRWLTNYRHIFHKRCLDHWMGYDQRMCPLCQTPSIPHHMQAAFNDRLWAASGILDFYYNHH